MPASHASVRLTWRSAVAFRQYFWQPPRAHGDVIEGREVSFLELFYDLIYVVVISRAAQHLGRDLTWAGLGGFAVVFGLIWLAWVNGALYHDLHGRAEGRTRTYVFLQMGLLALLAVFTGEATAGDGAAFAVVYSAFLFLVGWLWSRFACATTRHTAQTRRPISRASSSRPPSSERARSCPGAPAWPCGRSSWPGASPVSSSWTGAAARPGTRASTRASR